MCEAAAMLSHQVGPDRKGWIGEREVKAHEPAVRVDPRTTHQQAVLPQGLAHKAAVFNDGAPAGRKHDDPLFLAAESPPRPPKDRLFDEAIERVAKLAQE